MPLRSNFGKGLNFRIARKREGFQNTESLNVIVVVLGELPCMPVKPLEFRAQSG